jgi:hypothetical protein
MTNRTSSLVAGIHLAAASLFILLSVAPPPAFGQAHSESVESDESRGINAVGLFLGATTKFKDSAADETSFTIAGEYEYLPARWNHVWGFAGVLEVIHADELEALIIPLVYYHPTEDFFIRTGVGLEIAREDDAESTSAFAIWRIGVGYDIRLRNNMILVPSFDLDGIRSDPAIAYGIVIAKEY